MRILICLLLLSSALQAQITDCELRLESSFLRGDVDGNDVVEFQDGLEITRLLDGLPNSATSCDAADVDDDDDIDPSDAAYIWNWIYYQTSPPPAPFPSSGADPSADNLDTCVEIPFGTSPVAGGHEYLVPASVSSIFSTTCDGEEEWSDKSVPNTWSAGAHGRDDITINEAANIPHCGQTSVCEAWEVVQDSVDSVGMCYFGLVNGLQNIFVQFDIEVQFDVGASCADLKLYEDCPTDGPNTLQLDATDLKWVFGIGPAAGPLFDVTISGDMLDYAIVQYSWGGDWPDCDIVSTATGLPLVDPEMRSVVTVFGTPGVNAEEDIANEIAAAMFDHYQGSPPQGERHYIHWDRVEEVEHIWDRPGVTEDLGEDEAVTTVWKSKVRYFFPTR